MSRLFLILILLGITFNGSSQSTASGNVSFFELKAEKLDTVKRIWVYLPETYNELDKRYPVIYMHDGQNLFDRETSYVGEWQVDESLDSLGSPESIIIGIEHGGNKRIDELTPFPHKKYGGGKADDYLDFILEELKPMVDSTYRTLPGRKNTGIFGSSLGGLISFYAALKYPDTFGMIGVYSPSFWFNKKIYEFAEKAELNNNTRFYFLAGTAESKETIPDLKEMISLLQDKGIKSQNFKVKYVEGGKHNESMWSRHFIESYLWLMQESSN
ncbi:alpha/beta hydrolase [Christiangramia sabulilitoris]|uniref:Alpha/beta hydrolase n=1 Tax=Christiangramia sabulilitoris TaxID=2583991 RepID=A0A550I2Q1_9FLAO|nr:alpha/beta hydrolase-fold protein [Christiangramia sabulilitoris]TRO65256.1 alpha/beta hydrolase [Christiangramia sabulilitoris]